MTDQVDAVRHELNRQVAHWVSASARFDLDDLAAPEAWSRLEQYLDVALRRHLQGVIDRLRAEGDVLTAMNRAAKTPAALLGVQQQLLVFRRQFLRSELTLDYFADAINTRTNVRSAGLLRACDMLAYRSMAQILDQLGKVTPPTLSYYEEGVGAAVLAAGIRLWDGGELNPVAAIKITRHNILRPTAVIHEAGHQVARIVGWNEELAVALARGLARDSADIANVWSGWASEIAADAVSFVHTGYASVVALHDVLSGDMTQVFRHTDGDPHPMAYLRVLLGVETCRHFYGAGPWDQLAEAWTILHPMSRAHGDARGLIEASITLLDRIVRLTLDTPMQAFQGHKLCELVRPDRVSPTALNELSARIGPALYTSTHWLWNESLRILALTGLQLATRPGDANEIMTLQQQAMLRIGGALQAA